MYKTIDLNFLGLDHAIAAFLIESYEGLILIECGPYSTFQSLEEGLNSYGYKLGDVKHVLLSHIHFDHAGAAWAFAKRGANIYLHPFGASHMKDPSKLVASATMIYGETMDVLWGKMEGIDEERLKIIEHLEEIKIGQFTFISLHTPGHAKHHISWQLDDTIFTGDVAGCKIGDSPVVPPCPPPDIDIQDWEKSIEILRSRNPKKIVLTHFDAVENVDDHLDNLKFILNDWANWIKKNWQKEENTENLTSEFVDYTKNQLREAGVSEEIIKKYEAANPPWMSVSGLIRYWKKQNRS